MYVELCNCGNTVCACWQSVASVIDQLFWTLNYRPVWAKFNKAAASYTNKGCSQNVAHARYTRQLTTGYHVTARIHNGVRRRGEVQRESCVYHCRNIVRTCTCRITDRNSRRIRTENSISSSQLTSFIWCWHLALLGYGNIWFVQFRDNTTEVNNG